MSEIVVRKLCDEKLRYVLFSENIVGRYSDKTAKYMKKRSWCGMFILYEKNVL